MPQDQPRRQRGLSEMGHLLTPEGQQVPLDGVPGQSKATENEKPKPTSREREKNAAEKPQPEPLDRAEALAAAVEYDDLWANAETHKGLDLGRPLRADLLEQVRPALDALRPALKLPEGGLWRVFTATWSDDAEMRLEYQFEPELGRREGMHYGCNALELNALWEQLPPDQRPTAHPLAPIVAAWQARPMPAEPFRPKQRGSLPAFGRKSKEAEQLQLIEYRQPVVQANGQQLLLDLPELTPAAAARSWLLDLFDRAGGQSMRQGRGTPWEMRLFIGAMLHTHVTQRDGQWHSLRLKTAEVIRWLHPNGWPNRARDWERFPDALFRMNKELGFVALDGAYVQIIGATMIPKTPDFPHVEFIVRIPRSAAHGARIDWPTLCKYGQHSAVLYRGYLSAVEFMHLSARQGQPITQEINKPLLGKDGQPLRAKGGRVRRSTSEVMANPSTRYVRGLTEGELTEMIGLNPGERYHRQRARQAFERLDDDGVIDLEKDGKVWRIFGPTPHSS